MLQVHRLQEDQEGGVRVDTGMKLWLLSVEKYNKKLSAIYFHSSFIP